MFNYVTHRKKIYTYENDAGELALVIHAPRRGGSPSRWVPNDPNIVVEAEAALARVGRIRHQFGCTSVRLGDVWVDLPRTHSALMECSKIFHFAECTTSQPPPRRLLPAASTGATPADALDADPSPDGEWELACASAGLVTLELPGTPGCWQALGTGHTVPHPRLILRHPLVGAIPEGFDVPPPHPAPLPPKLNIYGEIPGHRYRYLNHLFSPCKLDPAGAALLYTWLLGAFHTISLTRPVPLLVVDSWYQKVGKTEITSALAHLFEGEGSSIAAPTTATDNDRFVAHFVNNRRYCSIDNLTGTPRWNHAWVATLCTERTAYERAKYGRGTTAFSGHLVAINHVWGTVTFAPDMLVRMWRIPLHGRPGPLQFKCQYYAHAFRDLIIADILEVHARAKPWSLPVNPDTRCDDFVRVGAAAYAELAGLSQERVNNILNNALKEVAGAGHYMLQWFTSENVTLPADALVARTRPGELRPDHLRELVGASALGYRAVADDQKGAVLKKFHDDAPARSI